MVFIKHFAVDKWLTMMGMMQYYHIFSRYQGVEDIVGMTEAEMREQGVENSSHRATILSSLDILQEKFEPKIQHAHLANSHTSPRPHPSTAKNRLSLSISPSEKMRSDLDNELRGDTNELRSHGWYHGNIPRVRAESLIKNAGEFLVRDCISKPGDFVLTTCGTNQEPLHFMINSRVLDAEPGCLPKILYQFEEKTFSSVQMLIQYHLSSQTPVTAESGMTINWPIIRRMPLSYYDTKFGVTRSPSDSPTDSPRMSRHGVQRSGSHPLLGSDDYRDMSKSPSPLNDKFGSLPMINKRLNGNNNPNPIVTTPPVLYHQRSGSEPMLTPTNNNLSFDYLSPTQTKITPAISDTNLNSQPPPKPSRIPSVRYRQRPMVVVRKPVADDGDDDDRDYGDYDTIKSKPSWLENKGKVLEQENMQKYRVSARAESRAKPKIETSGEKPKRVLGRRAMAKAKDTDAEPSIPQNAEPKDDAKTVTDNKVDLTRQGNVTNDDDTFNENAIDHRSNYTFSFDFMKSRKISVPSMKVIDMDSYVSHILPRENKPLEPSTVVAVKSRLLDSNVKLLATHLTYVDLDLLKVLGERDLGMGVQSGLEMITLPQGNKLRDAIIERVKCIRLFVTTTILTCTNTTERTRMLHQWIQIAMEMKATLGNLFGFVAVMDGIASPQISRLRDTWLVLRQIHTGSAYFYDTKLRSYYRAQNNGSAALPLQDVSIPNITPLVHLMQRTTGHVEQQAWESTDPSTSLDILLLHLDTARLICSQFSLYRITAENILKNFTPHPDLTDLFRTEFHLRFLWGSRGAGASREERFTKYEQLMTALSNRAERPGDEGTEL